MLIFLLLCVSVRSFIIPPPFLIPRFEIRNGNSLRLFRVKEQDEGTYTCTSENSVGKTEASAMLQVHGKKHIMHIVFEHTHTHTFACIKNLTYQEPVFMHTLTCSHMTTASFKFPFPVQRSLFLYQCIWVPVQWCCQELMLNRMDYAIWQMFGRCVL